MRLNNGFVAAQLPHNNPTHNKSVNHNASIIHQTNNCGVA